MISVTKKTQPKMQKTIILCLSLITAIAYGQNKKMTFGNGIPVIAQDSSFSMKFGMRFQNLYSSEWTVRDDNFSYVEDYSSNFVIRRSRLKFDGFAFTPDLTYKVELGIANGDISGGDNAEHSFASRFILDAYVDWNFYKNFTLRVGQAKLPGNRERVISSANMQFVDRSVLNSRYNIDRDMGIQLQHEFTIGKNIVFKEIASFSQGEGRDVTSGNLGGYDYTFRLEILPFGEFSKKGDYVGAAIVRESKPKLSIGATYDINDKSVRENGQLGDFIYDLSGDYAGKTLNTLFIDFMFKYSGLSIMGEYADKSTPDSDPTVYDPDTLIAVGRHFTGTGINVQAGWMFKSNWEIAARYTQVIPTAGVGANETEYTIGVSKYIVGHSLKVQTDISYRQRDVAGNASANNGRDDLLFWRLQMDIHL
jgi:phosphate-selective porin OprO and OprP